MFLNLCLPKQANRSPEVLPQVRRGVRDKEGVGRVKERAGEAVRAAKARIGGVEAKLH